MIIQGGADLRVPPENAAKMAARLQSLGYVYEYRPFPAYGHDFVPHTAEYMRAAFDFLDAHPRK